MISEMRTVANWWDQLSEEFSGMPLPPRPDRGWQQIGDVANRVVEQLRQRRAKSRAEWRSLYRQYLATPHWQARRQHVMQRCNGICEGCRERSAREVHHLTYQHVGEELLFELVALCDDCHDRVHRK
jgi:5-methylcytosine-specific restriction endonuclease McrA